MVTGTGCLPALTSPSLWAEHLPNVTALRTVLPLSPRHQWGGGGPGSSAQLAPGGGVAGRPTALRFPQVNVGPHAGKGGRPGVCGHRGWPDGRHGPSRGQKPVDVCGGTDRRDAALAEGVPMREWTSRSHRAGLQVSTVRSGLGGGARGAPASPVGLPPRTQERCPPPTAHSGPCRPVSSLQTSPRDGRGHSAVPERRRQGHRPMQEATILQSRLCRGKSAAHTSGSF